MKSITKIEVIGNTVKLWGEKGVDTMTLIDNHDGNGNGITFKLYSQVPGVPVWQMGVEYADRPDSFMTVMTTEPTFIFSNVDHSATNFVEREPSVFQIGTDNYRIGRMTVGTVEAGGDGFHLAIIKGRYHLSLPWSTFNSYTQTMFSEEDTH